MNDVAKTAGLLGLGAGIMYMLDPDRGRRRRALLRDKARRLVTVSERAAGKTSRDLGNRARGLAHDAASLLKRDRAGDEILESRVRTKLGRLVSHPHAIHVEVRDGYVTLTGQVLDAETHDAVEGVASMACVRAVEDRLERFRTPEGVPSLQSGPRKRPRERFELLQSNWRPAARFLVGMAGGGLAAYGVRQGGFIGAAAGMAGAAALARSITNQEMKRLVGAGEGRRAVDVRKTINVRCPVEQVFEFWANYSNFQKFMTHLREVRDLGNGRSRWVAMGPAGMAVEWEAEITAAVPNQRLAWKSVPGSAIETAGLIRFDRNQDGGTRIDIRLSYSPPAGAMGHWIARIFGADPDNALQEDLVRLKSLLEVGKTRVHGEKVTREQLLGGAKTLVPAPAQS